MSDAATPALAVLGLGGTIAMRSDVSGAVPALTADDLVECVPAALTCFVRHVENFRQLPGAHLGLTDLVSLARRIGELTEREGLDGFVVLQGTDTIEESVFALDLLCRGRPPVVVTGAMRHAGQTSADGALNIANSLCVAASPQAAGRGGLVCFNDEVHAAWAVRKTATTNVAAFTSPGFGPLGHVIEGRARFLFRAERPIPIDAEPAALKPARVAILAASLGEGPELVGSVGEQEYRGVVIEALGAGHLPASWVEPLTRLAETIPVVLATRVPRGPLLEATYAFAGSESDLLSRGLISAGYLSPGKARVLLSLSLGAGLDGGRIRDAFAAYRG
jgi:L-asparaginase